jgi:hypothetical protein
MNTSVPISDLTQRPPRSPRVTLGGYANLPRLIDKARAFAGGKLGAYHYAGKGMDRHFFNFVGLDHEAFAAEAAKGAGDGEILAWVQANARHPREPWEIAAWSNYHLHRTPDSDAETATYFIDEVKKFAPQREDIRTWFDLMDLDDYCSFGGKP